MGVVLIWKFRTRRGSARRDTVARVFHLLLDLHREFGSEKLRNSGL